MKIFLFFLEGNKNCRVSTKKNRVGRVSGNTGVFSSSEPLGSLVSLKYSHGQSSSICPSSTSFKDHLLQNCLAYQSQISYGASVGWGNESLFVGSGSHDQDDRHTHIR